MMAKRGNVSVPIQDVREKLLLVNGTHSGEEIRKIADDYNKGDLKQKTKALILYHISHDVYKHERHEADESVHWLVGLVKDLRLAAYDLAMKTDRRREIAIWFGITFASSLLAIIRRIRYVSNAVLLLAEAECLWHIANIHFRVGDYESSAVFLVKAVEFYTRRYGGSVHESDHYCVSLWIIGNCHYRMKQFGEATQYYEKFVSEVEKTEELSLQWLKIGNDDLAKATARNAERNFTTDQSPLPQFNR